MKTKTLIRAVGLLLLALVGGTWQMDARQLKVLAIGNSFSQDAVEQNLWELAFAQGDTLVVGNAFIGGCSIDRHWRNALTGDSAYVYRKIVMGRRDAHPNTPLGAILKDEPWDIVTLQQVSQFSGDSTTYGHLPDLMDYVRTTLQRDSVPLWWHLTWAYPQHSKSQHFKTLYHGDQLVMYRAILETADSLLPRVGIGRRVPTGVAIQRARRAVGDILNRDDIHLSFNEGRYAAACTWCEALTGRSVLGNAYHPQTVNAKMASILQSAAHKAVMNDSLGWGDSLRVLWLGTRSTFYAGVPQMVEGLARSQGMKLSMTRMLKAPDTPPTAFLGDTALARLLEQGCWDYVVIQESAPGAESLPKAAASRSYPYDRRLDEEVLASSPDARILCYNTWQQGRSHVPRDYPMLSTGWQAQRTQLRASRPHAASPASPLRRAPWMVEVGDAWREAYLSRPKMSLYDKRRHQPTPEGNYLTACSILRAILEHPFSSSYTAGIPDATARFLQQVAQDER